MFHSFLYVYQRVCGGKVIGIYRYILRHTSMISKMMAKLVLQLGCRYGMRSTDWPTWRRSMEDHCLDPAAVSQGPNLPMKPHGQSTNCEVQYCYHPSISYIYIYVYRYCWNMLKPNITIIILHIYIYLCKYLYMYIYIYVNICICIMYSLSSTIHH